MVFVAIILVRAMLSILALSASLLDALVPTETATVMESVILSVMNVFVIIGLESIAASQFVVAPQCATAVDYVAMPLIHPYVQTALAVGWVLTAILLVSMALP